VGDIGNVEQGRPDGFIQSLQALLEPRDLIADLAHLKDPGRGVRALLFHPRDLFGGLVLPGPELLDGAEDVPFVPGGLDEGIEAQPLAPVGQPILNEIKVFQDVFRV